MRTRFTAVLRRFGLLDATLWVRGVGRAARSAARAGIWKHRLSRTAAPTQGTRYTITRQRAGVWICELQTSVEPIQTFVEAFEQCLVGSEEFAPSEFGVLVRDGGAYPAIEMSERAWKSLVHRWHGGEAPWNLHVQRPSQRSRPECIRAVSRRTVDAIAGWTGRTVVFVAVAHPMSPFPLGLRLGVDVYVRPEIDESRLQRPWGEASLTDWVRKLRQPPFPIDAVYTWVDDSDPRWLERRAATKSAEGVIVGDSASAHRFANRDELLFSLRSVALYAEWFERVCVVTDRQTPAWADSSLEIVDHRDILHNDALPTFNSHAIETGLHRVPDLNEHYIYLNDDVFFDAPAPWSLFFTEDGRSRFFLSKALIPEVGSEATTIDHATSNGRSLVQREFGTIISQKMKHTPHAQRRSVHEWMETSFEQERRSTAKTQFRSTDDQSFASFLHHYVGVELDSSEVGDDLRYDYFNAADGRFATRLRALRDRPGFFTTYCINDGDVAEENRQRVDAYIHDHLTTSLPFPSSWESIPRTEALDHVPGPTVPGDSIN
jgi:hypothetical protein